MPVPPPMRQRHLPPVLMMGGGVAGGGGEGVTGRGEAINTDVHTHAHTQMYDECAT